jgi:hypothetical protein
VVVPIKDIGMIVPSKVAEEIVPSKTIKKIVLSNAIETIRHITCTSLITRIALKTTALDSQNVVYISTPCVEI